MYIAKAIESFKKVEIPALNNFKFFENTYPKALEIVS